MCGILGIFAPSPISLSDARVSALRDLMSHRGPDGAGLWRSVGAGGCILAHRRLAVIDPSDAAAQPMLAAAGRYALVYNGELYNDAELRAELAEKGVQFSTSSDTETILAALVHWGPAALNRFRGMHALAFYDSLAKTLLLARDPLGIKPLYYRLGPTADGVALVFASEPRPILEHPDIPSRPDWTTISAYLTTIRTTLGDRTLFEGVRTLQPGESIEFALADGEISPSRRARREIPLFSACSAPLREISSELRDSIKLHLRSDVPLCCMLSGGLDSSIIAAVMHPHVAGLHTYCSGAENADDFPHARAMSALLDTTHTEAPISRELFASRWPEMVSRLGLPLSTPNEVAINEIARRMRAAGHIVTLSGEGADELFGGYDIPLIEAARFEGLLPRDPGAPWLRPGVLHPGDFQLASNAWIQPADKHAVLSPDLWRACEHDDTLREFYRAEFDAAAAAPHTSPAQHAAASRGEHDPEALESIQPHLRFLRRVNLAGLLSRLDTAAMLEGIESRTPFADARIASLAESLPMEEKFSFFSPRPQCLSEKSLPLQVETKRILRRAFASTLPPDILARPKSSFPLPMQEWIADHAHTLRRSTFARRLFTIPAIETVAANPEKCWPLAWPMLNLAMWGDEWWP